MLEMILARIELYTNSQCQSYTASHLDGAEAISLIIQRLRLHSGEGHAL